VKEFATSDPLSLFIFLIVVEGNVMLKASLTINLYRSYGLFISRHAYISFAICYVITKVWKNIRGLKANFIPFEIILGLKFNFYKILVVRLTC